MRGLRLIFGGDVSFLRFPAGFLSLVSLTEAYGVGRRGESGRGTSRFHSDGHSTAPLGTVRASLAILTRL